MDDNDFDFFSSFEPNYCYTVGIHGDSTATKDQSAAAHAAIPNKVFESGCDAQEAAESLSMAFPTVLFDVRRGTSSYESETGSYNVEDGDIESAWLGGEEQVFSEVIK